MLNIEHDHDLLLPSAGCVDGVGEHARRWKLQGMRLRCCTTGDLLKCAAIDDASCPRRSLSLSQVWMLYKDIALNKSDPVNEFQKLRKKICTVPDGMLRMLQQCGACIL